MPTDEEDLGLGAYLGDRLVSEAFVFLRKTWEALDTEVSDEVSEFGRILGRIALRKALGEDVIDKTLLARSIAQDWCWVAADVVRGSLVTAAERIAKTVISALGAALLAVVRAALLP